MVDDPTRRRFLQGAGAIAVPALGALALGGCGGDEQPVRDEGALLGTVPATVAESEGGDAELLNSALAAEHLAIAAYTAAMPLLEGLSRDSARRFLVQERQHAARLRELIAGLGGSPQEPLPSYDFDPPGDQTGTLRLLQHVERRTIVVYGGVVPRLADPLLRATTASIAATEAEHVAVLRMRLGRWPAPTPFVTGAS